MNALDLIAAERQRQIDKEGWTPEHDGLHVDGEMVEAAMCYMVPPSDRGDWEGRTITLPIPVTWPWDRKSYKPTPNDRIRELVKAGALIAAEIDRLQRMEAQP